MESALQIDKYGTKRYYNDTNKLHREDGPAFEWRNGDREWWINGLRHRIGGPAVEWGGTKEWWIDGEQLTEVEFKHRANPCKCPDYLK